MQAVADRTSHTLFPVTSASVNQNAKGRVYHSHPCFRISPHPYLFLNNINLPCTHVHPINVSITLCNFVSRQNIFSEIFLKDTLSHTSFIFTVCPSRGCEWTLICF